MMMMMRETRRCQYEYNTEFFIERSIKHQFELKF